MELQKPKVAMYVKRPFGEKMNASFDFIKENWKPLLKYSTYLMLPICLIQALNLNGLMGGALNLSQLMNVNALEADSTASTGIMFFVHYLAYILLSVIGTILLCALTYTLIQKYNDSEERLQGVTWATLNPLLFRNVQKLILLSLATTGLVFVVVAFVVVLAVLTLYSLILTIPFLIACCVPLALLFPVYLFEDISVGGAFKKTFRLGFATWGGIFLISMVMGIIASVLQGVTMMPWYIATLVKYFFGMSDTGDALTVSAGYSFALYLMAILQAFGIYLSMIFSLVGLAYQYGHASEVVDSITVESDIDNFDKL